MSLGDFVLGEIGPSQGTNTMWFHLYEVLRVVKVMETEVKWWFPGAGGEGREH